ncbi:hypothetical protein H2198_002254 [Neophaeococcomyces mojaviensis]|uniref:Uncharacterized protein n=1 Tax=Neophaeococcomyces mojaviensis TaxID=3383035 RepID=A0ACC3AEX0_9EURO|nr:hypothetical protein H2198_002254 [Knufia sp. JES_112]
MFLSEQWYLLKQYRGTQKVNEIKRLLQLPAKMSVNYYNPMDITAVAAFANYANKYEKGTGGATRYIAQRLMSMSPAFTNDSTVLDNACGTGIVTEEIHKRISFTSSPANTKITVVAADAAAPMIDNLNSKIKHVEGTAAWLNIGSISTHVVPAESLDSTIVPSDSITHSYMNFGLFFCSDAIKAAEHIYRSLAPGGTAFVTTWKDLGYLNAVRKTEKACNPGGENFNMPFSAQWEDGEYVKDLLVRSGFAKENVKVVQEESFMRFEAVQEMARTLTESFTMLIRGQKGWQSDEVKNEWESKLSENLVEDEHFIQDGENGVAIRMMANIAVCTK